MGWRCAREVGTVSSGYGTRCHAQHGGRYTRERHYENAENPKIIIKNIGQHDKKGKKILANKRTFLQMRTILIFSKTVLLTAASGPKMIFRVIFDGSSFNLCSSLLMISRTVFIIKPKSVNLTFVAFSLYPLHQQSCQVVRPPAAEMPSDCDARLKKTCSDIGSIDDRPPSQAVFYGLSNRCRNTVRLVLHITSSLHISGIEFSRTLAHAVRSQTDIFLSIFCLLL